LESDHTDRRHFNDVDEMNEQVNYLGGSKTQHPAFIKGQAV